MKSADLTPNEHALVWRSQHTGGVLHARPRTFVNAVTWLRDTCVDELLFALLLRHRSTFDPVGGSFHAPSSNVTRSTPRRRDGAA